MQFLWQLLTLFSWFLLFFKSVIIQLWIKKARVSTPVSCGNWNLISRIKREWKKKPTLKLTSRKWTLVAKSWLRKISCLCFIQGIRIKMPLQNSSRLALYLSKVLEKRKKKGIKKRLHCEGTLCQLFLFEATQLVCGAAGFNFRSDSKGLPLLLLDSARNTLLEKVRKGRISHLTFLKG